MHLKFKLSLVNAEFLVSVRLTFDGYSTHALSISLPIYKI